VAHPNPHPKPDNPNPKPGPPLSEYNLHEMADIEEDEMREALRNMRQV
jgi:hypothetical protein